MKFFSALPTSLSSITFSLLLTLPALLATRAHALPLDGLTVTITSSYNGGAVESRDVVVNLAGGPEIVDGGGFGWMIPGDSIDFFSTSSLERLSIIFSSNHSPVADFPEAPVFDDGDYFDFTFRLPEGWLFDVVAITRAESTFPSATVDGNLLSVHIEGLAGMTGEGRAFTGHTGLLTTVVAAPPASVPDNGSSALLLGLALAGAASLRLRRAT